MKRVRLFPLACAALQRGMTLIELLVAMAIGLVLTLAVTSIVIVGESHKRTTSSLNDMGQSGAYAAYLLDRAVRGAGSGFVQSTQPTDRGVFGCKLNVASMLPRASAFPAPFAGFLPGAQNTLRVAPVLIAKSQSDGGSDVLMVMGGYAAGGGVSRPVTNPGSATTLSLDNTVAFSVNDLALVSQAGVNDCLLEQVSGIASKVLTLGGTYYTAGPSTLISTLAASTSTYVTALGNTAAGNLQMQLFGVGANSTLFSYDLLQGSGDTSQAVADGVLQLRALYGLDTNGDGVIDAWAAPSATGPDANGYDIATVMTTPTTMRQIIAVRIALVMRSTNYEAKAVSPASLTLFAGAKNAANASLAQTVSLSADDQHYRYRVIDSTIPLRNMLLLP
jgi:type IV pilus assembly protein PilW